MLVYLIVGLKPAVRAVSTSEYFIYAQKVSAADYANTSVAYALQVAALFLFVDWGIRYGLGALWVPIFWMAGFLLLYRALPYFATFHGNPSTLHTYLFQQFGQSRILQISAAAATVIGLWGTMMTEIDYTVQLYALPGWVAQFSLLAFFLLFGIACIVWNGFKAEVHVERFQLPASYCALIIALLLLLPTIWNKTDTLSALSIYSLLALALVVMAVGKFQTARRLDTADWQIVIPLVSLLVLLGVCTFFNHRAMAFEGKNTWVPVPMQFKAQGIIGVVSLFAANALWMIVDLSTWQRIAAVQSEENGAFPITALRRGTLRVLFESPATWLFGIVLGWSIRGLGLMPVGADPSEGLTRLGSALKTGSLQLVPPFSGLTWLVYPLLVYATVSIMLSTVNALASTISFTAFADLPPYRSLVSHGEATVSNLRQARRWTLAVIGAGLIAFPAVRYALGTSLPTFLYCAYSAQLSLFPVAVLSLLRRNRDRTAAIASVLMGLCMTGVAGALSTIINDPSAAVMPPLFAVTASAITYAIVYNPKRNPDIQALTKAEE
jgi:hypothetical protein